MTRTLLTALALLVLPSIGLACQSVTVGDVTVRNAWSRATMGTSQPGVFYLQASNAGGSDDALIGVSTPAAAMPMLHETVVTQGVASMPHVAQIALPAGQSLTLEPGGYHGMLMGLAAPLKAGDSFPLTLTFEKAGAVTIAVDILPVGAKAAACAP